MFDRLTCLKSALVSIAAVTALGAALTAPPAFAQTRPALVRDVDNPAQQPFRALINVNLGASETTKVVDGPTVPAGKRLVIENVSLWVFTGAPADVATGVWLTVPGASPPTFFLGDPTSVERKVIAGGGSITAYNRQVRLYYNAGEVIQANVFFDGTAGIKIVNYYLNGYLVNVP